MAAPSTGLGGKASHYSAVLKTFNQYGGAYRFGGFVESHPISQLLHMVQMGLPFQLLFHQMTQLTLSL